MERSMIGQLNESNAGNKVKIQGCVDTLREHGKVIFIDLRDKSGTIQTVVIASNKINFDKAKTLLKESCIELIGTINLRPKNAINDKIPTGKIEMLIEELNVFNLCPPLPFDLENKEVSEDVRLKYRFLDLRRPNMQKNLFTRAKTFKIMRSYLDSKNFTEFETPMLVKSTPGGARNYLVPSRIYPGKFFALPESPQLFKQLLMVAGKKDIIKLRDV